MRHNMQQGNDGLGVTRSHTLYQWFLVFWCRFLILLVES